jgi:hypothetical protein
MKKLKKKNSIKNFVAYLYKTQDKNLRWFFTYLGISKPKTKKGIQTPF